MCSPDRVADVCASLQAELWRHERIQVHQGKTQLWNRDGHGTDALTAAARIEDEDAIVWRGDPALPPQEQGVKLLGTPFGHAAYAQGQLARLSTSHDVLLERIQAVPDLQVAWLLLKFCAARANCNLRVAHPDLARPFAEQHDAIEWRCLQRLVGIEGDSLTEDMARLPLSFGLGLRSAVRTSPAPHWASWADCFPTLQERHPGVGRLIVTRLSDNAGDPHLSGPNVSRERLLDVSYNAPSWEQIADGLRPGVPMEDPEPGVPRHGWQFHATTQRHAAGDGEVPVDAQVFRVLLLRRFWRPLPLSASACRCGRPLDDLAHHRSACATSGVLGRRGFALESAAARVCREAGGRVTLSLQLPCTVRVSDLDLPPRGAHDQRRLEVVADGLPLFHGAQLAIDNGVSSEGDGRPGPQCARVDGAALVRARRRKETTYNELSGARQWLVVLACEVGGRWSGECQNFRRRRSGMNPQRSPRLAAKMEFRSGVLGLVAAGTPRRSWC